MKKRFTEEQIIKILQEGRSGIGIDELYRRHGIAKPTYYSWRAKFGGMNITEAKRLKALEAENSKLKRIVAE